MKATKIVGAVLGVLMVAALFTGAVAAADNEYNLGDVYTNVLYSDLAGGAIVLAGNETWTNIETRATVSFTQETGGYSIQDSAISAATSKFPGKYSRAIGDKTYIMNLKYPTATVTGYIYENKTSDVPIANLIGGIANTDNRINVTVPATIAGGANVAGIAFTNPEKSLTQIKNISFEDNVSQWNLGVWTVTPVFYKGSQYGFSNISPDVMYGEPVHFTLVSKDTTKKIVASSENVTQGGYVTIILTAPYGDWYVEVDEEGNIPAGQAGVTEVSNYSKDKIKQAIVHVDTSNVATFVVQSTTSNNLKVKLYDDQTNVTTKKEITIKVKAGAITAKADKDTVYIGDEVKITGTNDLGGVVKFFLKGTNYPLKAYGKYNETTGVYEEDYDVGSGKIWDAKIDTSKLISPDAGVYTLYVAKLQNESDDFDYWNFTSTDAFDDANKVSAYTTVSLSLLQPFITANVQNGVVVQSDKLELYGTAEGNPKNVQIYVFGTNFFKTDNASVLDDGSYTYTKKIVGTDKDDPSAWSMAAGQYFLVVQHKMYDMHYNIAPVEVDAANGNYNIVLNESADVFENGGNGTLLFNTLKRQSANAAQALIDAIGSQNIDDMQAHLSFIVAGPTSYVNAIPSQVTKGQALTISGTTTGHKNEMVAVELLSTAFAAVPKETVGTAAFATITTRIGDDGVWSVSFDTSNLNADDYTVSIAVGQLDPVTGKTKIVDGSTPSVTPTTQPTGSGSVTPTVKPTAQPTTTPATPGFGALAALVGLGAVAVLLLRRE